MELTQEQLDFFDTFGYLMIPQLFSLEETDKIIDGIEWSIGVTQLTEAYKEVVPTKPVQHL